MKAQVLNYYSGQERFTRLVFTGRKFAYAVVPNHPVKLERLKLDDLKDATPAMQQAGRPYPTSLAINHVETWAKEHGATAGVLKAIASIKAEQDADDETLEAWAADEAVAGQAKPKRKAKVEKEPAAPSAIGKICAELKIVPTLARRQLRAAGLRAPYTDEAQIKAILAPKPAKVEEPVAKPTKKATPAKAAPAKKVTAKKAK